MTTRSFIQPIVSVWPQKTCPPMPSLGRHPFGVNCSWVSAKVIVTAILIAVVAWCAINVEGGIVSPVVPVKIWVPLVTTVFNQIPIKGTQIVSQQAFLRRLLLRQHQLLAPFNWKFTGNEDTTGKENTLNENVRTEKHIHCLFILG